ncbi:MAG TPA: DUF6438 domain-containing protein, partial [Pyrinomonadaceae bacterium]|nr:DUF6438 domain-containing protein [Pyrinomonadaceae bacterium]
VCPAYKLDIQPDGKVIFEGIDFTKIKGKAESRLSEEKMNQLNAEINKSDFFSLKDSYTQNSGNCPNATTDSETVTTSVKLRDKEKTIVHYHGCGNDETRKLSNLENKIDEIAETEKWIGKTNERLPKK